MPEPFCKSQPTTDAGRNFVELVKSRRAEQLDSLLTQESELRELIDAPWFSFDSPAIVSAKTSEAVVKVLLKHGADINARSRWWAGSFGVLDGVPAEVAQFLVDRGARYTIHAATEQDRLDLVSEFLDRDPSLVNARGGDGQTPLHLVKSTAMVDLLLDHGADRSIRCLDHSATPAQYTVTEPAVCRHLIMRGAAPDIFMACAIGDRELVELVLREDPDATQARIGFCPHTRPVDPRSDRHIYFWKLLGAATPLEVAREFNQAAIFDELFRRSPPRQQFLAACWDGDFEKAQQVVSAIPDILLKLNQREQQELARAAWHGRLAAVDVMLRLGFDPHLPGDDRSTPLDRAAFHGFREVVELLLQRDPSPPLEFKNAYGSTPLGCCVYGAVHSWKRNTDHVGTARALIAAGAKVEPSWLPTADEAMQRVLHKALGSS